MLQNLPIFTATFLVFVCWTHVDDCLWERSRETLIKTTEKEADASMKEEWQRRTRTWRQGMSQFAIKYYQRDFQRCLWWGCWEANNDFNIAMLWAWWSLLLCYKFVLSIPPVLLSITRVTDSYQEENNKHHCNIVTRIHHGDIQVQLRHFSRRWASLLSCQPWNKTIRKYAGICFYHDSSHILIQSVLRV